MNIVTRLTQVKRGAVCLSLVFGLLGNAAQAGLVATEAVLETQAVAEQVISSYSQADFQTALASEELAAQLESMGVDVLQLKDRIASLTASEIQQLNAELEKQPAGGIVGALVTVFIVLVVTDMLCATNIFSFVNCINK